MNLLDDSVTPAVIRRIRKSDLGVSGGVDLDGNILDDGQPTPTLRRLRKSDLVGGGRVGITGDPTAGVGSVLTAALVGAPAGSVVSSYQWRRSSDNGVTWVNIAGATASAYAMVTADTVPGTLVGCLMGFSTSSSSQVVVPSESVPTGTFFVSGYAFYVDGQPFVIS